MIDRVKRLRRRFRKAVLFRTIRPGDTAIDCGANVGEITTQLARPGVEVYAFEPNSFAFKVLKEIPEFDFLTKRLERVMEF